MPPPEPRLGARYALSGLLLAACVVTVVAWPLPRALSDLTIGGPDEAEVPGPAPVLQLPLGAVPNGAVGWQAWHGQPVDDGVAWQMEGYRPAGWGEAMGRIPLVAALEGHGEVLRRWTTEQAGGFHYVVLYGEWLVPGGGHSAARAFMERRRQVSVVLGRPAASEGMVAIWVVPGVGAPLPALKRPTKKPAGRARGGL